MKKTLCTKTECGPCHVVKARLAALNKEINVKNYSLPEDRDFFIKHNIRAVPRLVIEHDDGRVDIIDGITEIVNNV